MRFGNRGVDGSLVVDVELYGSDGVAIFAGEILERAHVARGCRDAVTARERCFDPDPSEAFGRAGDEPNLGCHGILLAARGSGH